MHTKSYTHDQPIEILADTRVEAHEIVYIEQQLPRVKYITERRENMNVKSNYVSEYNERQKLSTSTDCCFDQI